MGKIQEAIAEFAKSVLEQNTKNLLALSKNGWNTSAIEKVNLNREQAIAEFADKITGITICAYVDAGRAKDEEGRNWNCLDDEVSDTLKI